MAIIAKKPDLVRNSIPQQMKVSANTLTIQEWNTTINALAMQTNKTTKYVEDIHRVLFHDYDINTQGYIEFPSGFIKYAHLNIEEILADAHVLTNRVSILEQEKNLHNLLTLESRSKPNQHPIHAITGLKEEISVHVGINPPTDMSRTWLQDITIEQSPTSDWFTLESNCTISDYNVIVVNTERVPEEPMRMLFVGDWFGSIYAQELHNNQFSPLNSLTPMFAGEILLSAKYIGETIETKIVYIEIDVEEDWYFVRVFENRGTVSISSFESYRIEVFR